MFFRALIFATVWIGFWYASSWVVTQYFTPASATWWSMGLVAFPIIFPLYLTTDFWIQDSYAAIWPRLSLALICLGGMLLYYPALLVLLWLIRLLRWVAV
ncbi:hypothetical protein [Pseudomonas sp. SCB32]|uniref:hypothetical protein n=1 Tax=Pseudomonas sp. SCB32 TaxID=2653853 RepID=UPI0012659561|nr:hypothetical protein [Pseudomonas sp. SCB32]